MTELDADVKTIRGIGEQRARALARLGIHDLRGLISYFPRTYVDRSAVRPIAQLQDGETACVEAMVAAPPTLARIRRGLELVKLRAVDASGALDVTFFNQAWLKSSLIPGESYVFYGRVERGAGRRLRMSGPVVEPAGRGEQTGRIVPVYALTAGVSQLVLSRSVRQGLDACRSILPDPLPDSVRREHQLCRIEYAYENIHFPASPEALELARRRLAFEELFFFTLGLRRLRSRREVASVRRLDAVDMAPFYAALPFCLTAAQRRCVDEALADMRSGRPMNRLCQGDVGSGKTMVAAACIYFCVKNGMQAAMMAPTEILAQQHYRGLSALMEGLGVRCALLTGSMGARARRQTLEGLALGQVDLVVGTHALISGGVEYQDLGLVVTDEQHRFGVGQRAALAGKGSHPHTLVMSATPIPRTLALILYGDLDVSVIDQLPPGRQRVETVAVSGGYRQRLYEFVRRQTAEGGQCCFVCPQVSEREDGSDDVKAAEEYARTLREEVFPALRVGLVHGKLKPKEKEAVMSAFSAGEVDVLVATTVIEVGVDVPNANVMVVENAERFGLSQLHQLRGRVGRGARKSYCVLVSDSKNEETRQRLRVMTRTNDGFQIAEEDLRLRGPGDFFGLRQHGLPGLRVADLGCDAALLKEAQEAADGLLAADPTLAAFPAAAQRVEVLFRQNADALN